MINSRLFYASILMIAFIFGTSITDSFAESNEIPELLTEISETQSRSNSLVSLNHTTDFVHRSELVSADVSVFDSDQISITFFNETMIFTKDRIEMYRYADYGWIGTNDTATAILLVSGINIYGLIETRDSTYIIELTEMGQIHWVHEMNLSLLPPEYGFAEDEIYERTATTKMSRDDQEAMDRLEGAYDGTRDYGDNSVVIDIITGYSDTVFNRSGTLLTNLKISMGIGMANNAYNNNELPIVLNLLSTMRVSNYVEDTMENDLPTINTDMGFFSIIGW